MGTTKRVMLTVDKAQYDRFRIARIKAGLPNDLLSKQVGKMIDAALLVCDSFEQGDLSRKGQDLEQAILDLLSLIHISEPTRPY